MALFSRNKEAKETKTKKDSAQKVAQKSTAQPSDRNLSSVLIKPRVTEKAAGKSDQNIYTFDVRRDATKYDVRAAVIKFFGVTPVRVNIVNKSPRQFKSKKLNRVITEKGLKKAYVYLKDGDSINLV